MQAGGRVRQPACEDGAANLPQTFPTDTKRKKDKSPERITRYRALAYIIGTAGFEPATP